MPDFKAFQKASETASGFANQVKERATEKLSETMDSGFGKLNSVLDDLNSALPVLQEAGYPVDLVEIELGINPKISIRFSTKIGVKEERLKSLLEEHADHRMTITLLNALGKGKQLQSKVRLAGLKAKGIEIKIGVLPEVALRFG